MHVVASYCHHMHSVMPLVILLHTQCGAPYLPLTCSVVPLVFLSHTRYSTFYHSCAHGVAQPSIVLALTV
jgi:hypothetical protein